MPALNFHFPIIIEDAAESWEKGLPVAFDNVALDGNLDAEFTEIAHLYQCTA